MCVYVATVAIDSRVSNDLHMVCSGEVDSRKLFLSKLPGTPPKPNTLIFPVRLFSLLRFSFVNHTPLIILHQSSLHQIFIFIFISFSTSDLIYFSTLYNLHFFLNVPLMVSIYLHFSIFPFHLSHYFIHSLFLPLTNSNFIYGKELNGKADRIYFTQWFLLLTRHSFIRAL